ncbi:hypothetical protein ALC53_09230 [Atta colombica]|uniref:Uncharacterized protein n=1 Tax=Atta colombica TaxID=520822 RepID=A0A195B6K3_9HYME|nr:hypothetical protein ALC53_09230 [Atta colombica]
MAVMYKRRNKAVGLFASRNRHPQVIEFPSVCIVFVRDSASVDRKSTISKFHMFKYSQILGFPIVFELMDDNGKCWVGKKAQAEYLKFDRKILRDSVIKRISILFPIKADLVFAAYSQFFIIFHRLLAANRHLDWSTLILVFCVLFSLTLCIISFFAILPICRI